MYYNIYIFFKYTHFLFVYEHIVSMCCVCLWKGVMVLMVLMGVGVCGERVFRS